MREETMILVLNGTTENNQTSLDNLMDKLKRKIKIHRDNNYVVRVNSQDGDIIINYKSNGYITFNDSFFRRQKLAIKL